MSLILSSANVSNMFYKGTAVKKWARGLQIGGFSLGTLTSMTGISIVMKLIGSVFLAGLAIGLPIVGLTAAISITAKICNKLVQKDVEIKDLGSKLEGKDTEIAELNQQLQEAGNNIGELTNQVADLKATVAKLVKFGKIDSDEPAPDSDSTPVSDTPNLDAILGELDQAQADEIKGLMAAKNSLAIAKLANYASGHSAFKDAKAELRAILKG
jgi:hypothetical protein